MKLTVRTSTNPLSEKLDNLAPGFNACEGWIVANSRQTGERMPKVCHRPDTAKNSSRGAKMQSR